MELQFGSKEIPCLRRLGCQVLYQEQTAEVRLDDSMPPVGKVLGAWGQVLLRGKEWRNGSVQVSGGVMAWVLYLPEEGGACQSVEAWLPFQWKVDIPATQRDGTVIAGALLRSVDGRSLSSRKLMVRANVGLKMQMTVPDQVQVFVPEELPEHIQLHKEKSTMQLPVEAGEKPFVIDEQPEFPASCPKPEKLMYYCLRPELLDKKVMADKVVFRGAGILHTVYLGQDGRVYTWDFEMPFAQYSDLTGQYEEDAVTSISLAVTSLEVTLGDNGKLLVNAGMTGQYVIYHCPGLEWVRDGYSTQYRAEPIYQQVELYAVSQLQSQSLPCKAKICADTIQVVDTAFYPEHPALIRTDTGMCAELCGRFQMLHYNRDGELEIAGADWNGDNLEPENKESRLEADVMVSGSVQTSPEGEDTGVQADLLVETFCLLPQDLQMISGFVLTEKEQEDKPSLILRRAGNETLWDMAKATGSTVQQICSANALEGDPQPGKMLIIPVL